jgi:hypothetical protein
MRHFVQFIGEGQHFSYIILPCSSTRQLSGDLIKIAHVAAFGRRKSYDNVRFAEICGAEGHFMVIKRKASFNPKSFLAKVGEGRSIGDYRKDQIVFS